MSDKDGQPIAQGSGFVVSKDGRIVTNYHVVKSGVAAIVKLPDGAFFAVDGMLAFDKNRDIAVIKAHGENFHTVALGDSSRVQVGDEVVAIGNPLSLESTVSNGIVSAIRDIKEEGGKFLQITAPISPGSSGGPLFSMMGEVVGITSSGIKGGENLNFSIPINDAKALLLPQFSKLQPLPGAQAVSGGFDLKGDRLGESIDDFQKRWSPDSTCERGGDVAVRLPDGTLSKPMNVPGAANVHETWCHVQQTTFADIAGNMEARFLCIPSTPEVCWLSGINYYLTSDTVDGATINEKAIIETLSGKYGRPEFENGAGAVWVRPDREHPGSALVVHLGLHTDPIDPSAPIVTIMLLTKGSGMGGDI